MKRRNVVGMALFVGIAGHALASPAAAKTLDLRLDTNFHTKEGVTAASPVLRVAVPLGGLSLRADWGVVFGDIASETEFKPLNPFIGASFDVGLGVMNLSVGAGLAIPALRFSETASNLSAYAAASMVGFWDPRSMRSTR